MLVQLTFSTAREDDNTMTFSTMRFAVLRKHLKFFVLKKISQIFLQNIANIILILYKINVQLLNLLKLLICFCVSDAVQVADF